DPTLDGTVDIRASRGAVLSLLDADPTNDALAIGNGIVGYRALTVEGVESYTETDGVITANQIAANATSVWYQDAATFMTNETAVAAALGRSSDTLFRLTPGIDISSPGNLRLAAPWNLSAWR